VENDEPQRIPDDEQFVRAEEKEAAAEAGAIGGEGSNEDLDPAARSTASPTRSTPPRPPATRTRTRTMLARSQGERRSGSGLSFDGYR
jgi:hypothetical protein